MAVGMLQIQKEGRGWSGLPAVLSSNDEAELKVLKLGLCRGLANHPELDWCSRGSPCASHARRAISAVLKRGEPAFSGCASTPVCNTGLGTPLHKLKQRQQEDKKHCTLFKTYSAALPFFDASCRHVP
jgi:hypothetical protein